MADCGAPGFRVLLQKARDARREQAGRVLIPEVLGDETSDAGASSVSRQIFPDPQHCQTPSLRARSLLDSIHFEMKGRPMLKYSRKMVSKLTTKSIPASFMAF